ncbi:hypothetical protein [Alkalihalophilus marmarensis]|uniref:hypothetical protein n=1 Tax=Alkalihalophilus marmarensis TaxID=521377 RepID=UPI002DBEB4F0|nr:hypothetical protein [Alkalihalophilus marmarensis]MEC2073197.1 hypothetical protein [Alkalihalophilus marmarensis]
MQRPIAPAVHRSIYNYSVKYFLEKQGKDHVKKAKDLKLQSNDELKYHKILDFYITKDEINRTEVNNFLFEQVNYGRMKNIFIYEIQNINFSKVSNFENIIHCINNLKYKNANTLKEKYFVGDLRKGLKQNEKELFCLETFTDSKGHLESIHLLLAKGIKNNQGEDCNHYIPVEIKLKERKVYIRMKNWESSAKFYGFKLDEEIKKVVEDLKHSFDFTLQMPIDKTQSIIRRMLRDLTQTVLMSTQDKVNNLIEEDVRVTIRDWAKKTLPTNVTLLEKDYINLEKYILNHFYSLKFKFDHKDLTTNTIQQSFNVPGYPTYVKFTDDTISEARTKSQSTSESLLLTSIYYDLKARLDDANQIRLATVYWTDAPIRKNLGVSYKGDVQNQLNVVVKYNFFNKEIYDHVLQKIRKYY